MAAPYVVGDVIFLHRPGSCIIAAEIIAHNAMHPSLFDLWFDGQTVGPVNVTERGQNVLRSAAPKWAIDAVDNGPWGDK